MHTMPSSNPSICPAPISTSAIGDTSRQDVDAVVSSVVDDIVDRAVNKARTVSALDSEKRNVQNLINNLVARVQSDAAAVSAPKRPSATPPRTMQSRHGVPRGDIRPRTSPNYPITWTQAVDSLTLTIIVPSWVNKSLVDITFSAGAVKARIAKSPSAEPFVDIDQPLLAAVDPLSSLWALEENSHSRMLILELEKARIQWWPRLFMADDPSEYVIVDTSSPRASQAPVSVPTEEGSKQPTEKLDKQSEEQPAPAPAPAPTAAPSPLASPNQTSTAGKSPVIEPAPTVEQSSPSPQSSKPKSNTKSVEDTVSEMVEEIIDNASSCTPRTRAASSQPARPPLSSRLSQNRNQRLLSKADLPNIIEQYKESIKNNDRTANESAVQLATFYHHGIGLEQNDAEAARLYKFALERGVIDPSASFQLGLIYNQGAPGLEVNPKEAVRWWRVSASLGNPVAMFNLGVMYMNGSGCEMDPIMATRWFQQAQALNPQLQPPQFTRAQLEKRIATAMKLKKDRVKLLLPPEERERRREQAMKNVRTLAYGSTVVAGLAISAFAVRYWLRNRL